MIPRATGVRACVSSPPQALQGQGMAPRLPLVLEDVRLLLLRLAHQESLSVDCGGGASRSNVQLIPYQMQVCYIIY